MHTVYCSLCFKQISTAFDSAHGQTQWKLFTLYRNKNAFLTTFYNSKHDYIKNFIGSSKFLIGPPAFSSVMDWGPATFAESGWGSLNNWKWLRLILPTLWFKDIQWLCLVKPFGLETSPGSTQQKPITTTNWPQISVQEVSTLHSSTRYMYNNPETGHQQTPSQPLSRPPHQAQRVQRQVYQSLSRGISHKPHKILVNGQHAPHQCIAEQGTNLCNTIQTFQWQRKHHHPHPNPTSHPPQFYCSINSRTS